jgi:hypothetical protein
VAESDDTPGGALPRIVARNLEGERVVIPDDLPAALNLLVFAFRRQQQALVDSWLATLERLAAADARLGYYEVPTIARRWRPARRVIDGGMAAAIADIGARRRTLTVYADVSCTAAAFGIRRTDTVTLVLLDRDGRVRWRGEGGYAPELAAGLRAAVASAQPSV